MSETSPTRNTLNVAFGIAEGIFASTVIAYSGTEIGNAIRQSPDEWMYIEWFDEALYFLAALALYRGYKNIVKGLDGFVDDSE